MDPTDSVHAYEEAGKINSQESQYEKGMKALASLGRIEQLTAIEGRVDFNRLQTEKLLVTSKLFNLLILIYLPYWTEYNNMKERLKQYLQKFAENKKVVREEDIKEFFSEMESKKRPKVVIPTYCRWSDTNAQEFSAFNAVISISIFAYDVGDLSLLFLAGPTITVQMISHYILFNIYYTYFRSFEKIIKDLS